MMLDTSIPVSAHAVLRYMTRILKLSLTPIEGRHQRASTWSLLAEAAQHYGLDAARLQREICPEHIEAAVRGGAARIRRQGYVLICSNGVVVTLVTRTIKAGKIRAERSLRHDRGRIERRRRAGVKCGGGVS